MTQRPPLRASARRRTLLAGAAAAALLPLAPAARAAVPPGYKPMVIEPTGMPQRWEFDLGPAFERARREKKRLYLYLGASDCPYCRRYEAFLAKNEAELVPHFAKDWIFVELRSALTAKAALLHFRSGGKSLNYTEYMRSLGDERERQLVYPSVWLFDASGKTLMQMPAGTGTFETVGEQLEILRLEQ